MWMAKSLIEVEARHKFAAPLKCFNKTRVFEEFVWIYRLDGQEGTQPRSMFISFRMVDAEVAHSRYCVYEVSCAPALPLDVVLEGKPEDVTLPNAICAGGLAMYFCEGFKITEFERLWRSVVETEMMHGREMRITWEACCWEHCTFAFAALAKADEKTNQSTDAYDEFCREGSKRMRIPEVRRFIEKF